MATYGRDVIEGAADESPDEAGTGTFSSAPAISAAMRAALAFPARPVVTSARATTTAPSPATIHQPGLVAAVKPAASGPCR